MTQTIDGTKIPTPSPTLPRVKSHWKQWCQDHGIEPGDTSPHSRIPFLRHRWLTQSPNQRSFVSLSQDYESLLSRDESRQSGIFYTPEPIAQYLTHQLMEQALGQSLRQHFIDNPDTFHDLRVVDPACGTGIFLQAILKEFDALAGLLPPNKRDTFWHHALNEQLWAMDIDPVAITIAQWGIEWFLTTQAKHPPQAPHINPCPHIVVGNALLDEGAQWFSPGGFLHQKVHVVLGNPPYVTEVRGNKEIFQELRQRSWLQDKMNPKMDLCDLFIYLAMDVLKDEGHLGYVLPDYWMTRQSASSLRAEMAQQLHFKELWTAPGETSSNSLFDRAPGHHTSLLVAQKKPNSATQAPLISHHCHWAPLTNTPTPQGLHPTRLHWSGTANTLVLITAEDASLTELLSLQQGGQHPPLTLQPEEIQQGLVMPQSRIQQEAWQLLSPEIQEKHPIGSGVFVLTSDEKASIPWTTWEEALLKPFYWPSQWDPNSCLGFSGSHDWILYVDQGAKKLIHSTPHHYPNLRKHFEDLSPLLTSSHKPYGLHRPRQAHWFEQSTRLLCPRQTPKPHFKIVTEPAYVHEGFIIVRPLNPHLQGHLNHTVAWLNSPQVHQWLWHHKRKGNRLQLDKDVLLTVPFPPKNHPYWISPIS